MNKVLKSVLAGAVLAGAFAQGAAALEVGGVTYKDTVKVGGKELVLSGAGIRTKFVIKVYTVGIYLPAKQTNVADIMNADTPRRAQLVMLRGISQDDFGSAFMTGITGNMDKAEKARFVGQISKFGEIFASFPALNKGDVVDLDYVPGVGTKTFVNGKQVGETTPEFQFNNAILKIWLGDKPVDARLKPKLLGAS